MVFTDSTGNRVKVPTGSQCSLCVQTVMICFATYGWALVLAWLRTKPGFLDTFEALRSKVALRSVPWKGFQESEVEVVKIYGRRVESDSWLIPKSLLEATFGSGSGSGSAGSLDSILEPYMVSLWDQHGEKLQGCLVEAPQKDAPDAAVKKVTTFCEEYYLKKDLAFSNIQLASK